MFFLFLCYFLVQNHQFASCKMLVETRKKERGDDPRSWTHIVSHPNQIVRVAHANFPAILMAIQCTYHSFMTPCHLDVSDQNYNIVNCILYVLACHTCHKCFFFHFSTLGMHFFIITKNQVPSQLILKIPWIQINFCKIEKYTYNFTDRNTSGNIF